MMLESFRDKTPKLAESAFVHPSAIVRGDVEIGEYSIVWPGASITGDMGAVRIGKCVIIEDNCVVHAGSVARWELDEEARIEIGDNVTIGHGAVVHGKRIGNRVMVGMNATILEEADIGDKCIVAAGAVVTEGMEVPEKSLVAGVPASVKGHLKEEDYIWTRDDREADIAYYADYIERLKASKLVE